jgi:hypothetical protein
LRRAGRRAGVRQALVVAALVPGLAACESTQEKSAQLEREAKAHSATVGHSGLSIKKASHDVQVLTTALVANAEATAAVVILRDTSPYPLRDVPIAITVRDRHGRVLYQNNGVGLSQSLTSAALLQPGMQFDWVDDQVQLPTGAETAQSGGAQTRGLSVQARVGEAPEVHEPAGALPKLEIAQIHPIEDPGLGEGAAGTLHNTSSVSQTNVVVYGVASRAAHIVAAGRAELPTLAAAASAQFELFLVGDAKGAKLTLSAPPSTFG